MAAAGAVHTRAPTGSTVPGGLVADVPVPGGLLPAVARDAHGRPRLALTLLLDRLPEAAEPDLAPLVARGVFAVTVTLSAPDASAGDGAMPFVQTGEVRLIEDDSSRPLARAGLAGNQLTTTLGTSLRSGAALDLLGALDGAPSGLVLEHDIEVRGEPACVGLRLSGTWARVWDVLAARSSYGGALDAAALVAACREAITTGVVRVAVDGHLSRDGDTAAPAVELLRSGVGFMLEEVPGGVYTLRPRPSELMPLAVAEEIRIPTSRTTYGRTPLEDLLAGVVGSGDRDRVVRLVALDPAAVGTAMPVVPVPRLVHTRERRARARADFLAVEGRLTSVPLVLGDETQLGKQSAATAYEALVTKPTWLDTLVVADPLYVAEPEADEPGPIMTGGEDAVYVDRLDPARRWYVPEYRLRRPTAGIDPAASPFAFTFATLGVASGPVPTVGLDATIRVTVEPVMGDATRQALESLGNPPAEPVPAVGMTAALQVPYRPEGSGDVQFHTLTGDVAQADGGALVLTVRALDAVARLSYGSLAYEGFQPQPAAVVVQFSFRGWTRSASRSTRSIETLRDNGKAMLTLNKDFGLGNVHVLPQKTTLPLQWIDVLPERIPQYELLEPVVPVPSSAWTACVVGRAARVPAVVTCAEHPDLYRQSAAGNERAIGCQDALRLGESPPPAYADVPAAAGASHRVLRSLQQPGRFIVLPALFKITRSGPEAGERAFRPNILVHAALGGSGGDRYVFTAGLAPAIRMHEWAALVRQLRGMCPPGVEPQVQLPLEPTVQAQLAYSWTLPPDIAEPVVTRTWEGFQVAVSAQLAAGLLLNSLIETSGLHGEVEFTLPGGLAVSSMLVLDTDVVGPWQSSPVTVAVRRDEATLVNRAERPADVFSLLTHGGELAATVDQTLAPGQQLKVPLDTAPGELIAVHSLHNSSLRIEQLSAYVSDVTTTLHIVNLVNYANSGLTRLDLEVKHAGAVHECPIDERGEAEVALTFPLTSYLAARTVDVRVLQTFAEGRTTVTAWFPWDLASAGGVLSLTSQLIGLAPPS